MDTEFPTLRRPQRRLYFSKNKSSSKQWAGKLSLEDVDKLFDDLDSASDCSEDILPLSPIRKTKNKGAERTASLVLQPCHLTENGSQMDPKKDVFDSAVVLEGTKEDIELDSPFKSHGPCKTSSPLEEKVGLGEQDDGKDRTMSPLLFFCEDNVQEEPKIISPPNMKPHCKSQTPEDDEVMSDSPPNRFSLCKYKTSADVEKVAIGTEPCPVPEGTPQKCPTLGLKPPNVLPIENGSDPETPAIRLESQRSPPVQSSQPPLVKSHAGKPMSSFLLKLREAMQPKPARKVLSPVKEPPPPLPEPEEDFLILEDDPPQWFCLTKKMYIQGQSKTSSNDEKTFAGRAMTTSQPEKEDRGKMRRKGGGSTENDQTVPHKTKKDEKVAASGIPKKSTVKNPKSIKSVNDVNENVSPSREEVPAGDLMEDVQQQHSKKQSNRSKVADKEEDPPKHKSAVKSIKRKSTLLTKNEARRSLGVKQAKSAKNGEEIEKCQGPSRKRGQRKVQKSEVVEKPLPNDALKESSSGGDAKLSDRAFKNTESKWKRKVSPKIPADTQGHPAKPSNADEEGSSGASQALGRRKRNKPGEWWLSCPTGTVLPNKAGSPPTLKKSKWNTDGSEAEAAPPANAEQNKEERLNEKKKHPVSLSSRIARNRVEKKSRPTKNMGVSRKKSTEEAVETDLADGHHQELQQVPDQNQEPEGLSPLVSPTRPPRGTPGDKVFHRIYQPTPTKPTTKSAAEQEAVMSGKRSRKATGSWWMVSQENLTEQLQRRDSRSQKARWGSRAESKPSPAARGTLKNAIVGDPPRPPEGANETHLKRKLLSAPKTIRPSFSAVTESSTTNSSQKSGFNQLFPLPEEESCEEGATDGQSPITDYAEDAAATAESDDALTAAEESLERRKRLSWPPRGTKPPSGRRRSYVMSSGFQSGPTSMIETFPLSPLPRVQHAAFSPTELCGPPLAPLALQVEDKRNLTEWLNSLWPTTVETAEGPITPDHFQWFSHRGRALGFHVDLLCEAFCNGKILLGSYMKKPLWVDHSAMTVFNVLTSCVGLTIDAAVSRHNPGQSFMVPCGCAYSIQNLADEPAVVLFTRIQAGALDIREENC